MRFFGKAVQPEHLIVEQEQQRGRHPHGPWRGGAGFGGGLLLWGALFALIPTVCAYVLYYRGLGRIREPSRVPVIASVETVVAAAVGAALYHDRLGVWGTAGILLVLISIGVMNLPPRKSREKTGEGEK